MRRSLYLGLDLSGTFFSRRGCRFGLLLLLLAIQCSLLFTLGFPRGQIKAPRLGAEDAPFWHVYDHPVRHMKDYCTVSRRVICLRVATAPFERSGSLVSR